MAIRVIISLVWYIMIRTNVTAKSTDYSYYMNGYICYVIIVYYFDTHMRLLGSCTLRYVRPNPLVLSVFRT